MIDLDHSDARRIIEAATTICAVPGMASPAAREIATTHLRAMLTHYTAHADVLEAMIKYLEKI